jgi:hypothetical protein
MDGSGDLLGLQLPRLPPLPPQQQQQQQQPPAPSSRHSSPIRAAGLSMRPPLPGGASADAAHTPLALPAAGTGWAGSRRGLEAPPAQALPVPTLHQALGQLLESVRAQLQVRRRPWGADLGCA